jgi:hypothetical protein
MPETKTPYGDVDSEALQGLRQSFDTRTILHAVELLDGIRARCAPDGLRDDLLRLHGMAHTVINDASLAYSTDGPTLVEQVDAVLMELGDWLAALERMRQSLEPLEHLSPAIRPESQRRRRRHASLASSWWRLRCAGCHGDLPVFVGDAGSRRAWSMPSRIGYAQFQPSRWLACVAWWRASSSAWR